MTTPQTLNDKNRPLTVGDWIITFIILMIPFVNLIMLLYWGLSSGSNINRKNFCLAYLILIAIAIGLAFVFGILAFVFGEYSSIVDIKSTLEQGAEL